MTATVRIPSKRRTCDIPWCDSCRWPRRSGKGPHLRAESVPAGTGPAEAIIFRVLHSDGTRAAFMLRRHRDGWSDELALPSRPRVGHGAAVQRARRFVRTGAIG